MRLIILTGLIVLTFVLGFLFAHDPFREVVIKKTVKAFFDDEKPSADKTPPAPAAQKKPAAPQPAATGKSPPAPAPAGKRDDLTEKDRRQLEDLIEEKLAKERK